MRLMAAALSGLVLLGACSDLGRPARTNTVATTSVVMDIVAHVVPNAVIFLLIDYGLDPHDYQPTPGHLAEINAARTVVAVGGGLEEGLGDVLEAAEEDGVEVVELISAVDPIMRDGEPDPHFWLDPLRVQMAAVHIGEHFDVPDFHVEFYTDELEAVHNQVEEILAVIPPENRLLVTGHDSLAYFADRYGFDVAGVIIPGGSTHGDPSSEHLAGLVDLINERQIPAIFVDSTESKTLAEAVAAEADHPVEVVELFVGSLIEGSAALTIADMIRTNANRIADALAG